MALCEKCAEIQISDSGVEAVKKSIAEHHVQIYLDSWKRDTGTDYNIELGKMKASDLLRLAEKCNSINQRNTALIAYTHAHIAVSKNAPKWNCSACLGKILHAGTQ